MTCTGHLRRHIGWWGRIYQEEQRRLGGQLSMAQYGVTMRSVMTWIQILQCSDQHVQRGVCAPRVHVSGLHGVSAPCRRRKQVEGSCNLGASGDLRACRDTCTRFILEYQTMTPGPARPGPLARRSRLVRPALYARPSRPGRPASARTASRRSVRPARRPGGVRPNPAAFVGPGPGAYRPDNPAHRPRSIAIGLRLRSAPAGAGGPGPADYEVYAATALAAPGAVRGGRAAPPRWSFGPRSGRLEPAGSGSACMHGPGELVPWRGGAGGAGATGGVGATGGAGAASP